MFHLGGSARSGLLEERSLRFRSAVRRRAGTPIPWIRILPNRITNLLHCPSWSKAYFGQEACICSNPVPYANVLHIRVLASN